ncbi:hypothetical protein HN681_04580 [archaeon]|jgi:hypothetical protein|nr:hypothetical protein [archaeon]MBT3730983.1 hypothetical protein [archaeon]MBT4669779.1 hypothetical protein [archaeon]MBT5029929.1 hypothetical protein [archaeon]MBT5288501.1 hypothetical protein [archaeon]
MASELTQFMNNLESLGFYDVALPFILIFTLIFAILQKIKIFGENSKNFNAIIALSMALLVVRQVSIVEIMNQFLPQVSLIALVFVVILLLIGILLGPSEGWSGLPLGLGVLLTLGAVSWALFASASLSIPSWLEFSQSDWYLIIGIGLFFVFLFFITSEPGKSDKGMVDLFKGLGSLSDQLGRKNR